MIRIRQVEVSLEDDSLEEIKKQAALKLKVKKEQIRNIKIHKQSLDARRKPKLKYIYEVDVSLENENQILFSIQNQDVFKTPTEEYSFSILGKEKINHRIIIVGSGPAGLFTAYLLAKHGYNPLVIERGEKMEDRIKTVEQFWIDGKLNINSNVQFGEGGAGTFSDGKLNTLVKDKVNRMKEIFSIFVECGASSEILYENKPHIGTDILRNVVKNMRNKIIEMGGEFRYLSCLTDLKIENQQLKQIEINYQEWIPCEILVLAIGHSARDTFEMLDKNGLKMSPKPFAIGIRIEHPQKLINKSQYGIESHPKLKPASYKLTYTTSSKRGVYSFCMCPGGYVVNASSEEGMLAINGMSNYRRESENANSAIIVTVTPNDFGHHVLSGLEFQRKLEKLAYQKGNGKIPIQLYKDFKNNQKSKEFGNIKPILKGTYEFTNLQEILPDYISKSLIEGIDYFGTKIKDYDRDDAILLGVESRTSSPIRMERDDFFLSNIEGIYPCGEGSGYAGGITTSAMDGMKIAEAIAKRYSNEFHIQEKLK